MFFIIVLKYALDLPNDPLEYTAEVTVIACRCLSNIQSCKKLIQNLLEYLLLIFFSTLELKGGSEYGD